MSGQPDESGPAPLLISGKAAVIRHAYEGGELSSLLDGLVARINQNSCDAAALMDLSIVLGAANQPDKAREIQAAALAQGRIYRLAAGINQPLRLVAFVAAGDFMANTPLEFLVEGAPIDLWLVYLDAAMTRIDDVPAHDVAFMAVGESAANAPLLRRLPQLLKGWPRPILNNAPEVIAALTRDEVCRLFVDEPSILAPPSVRVKRTTLEEIAGQDRGVQDLPLASGFPFIVRPLDTHAGIGMEKVADAAELNVYLQRHSGSIFYVMPFVDYSGSDGLFRKQRIVFINGRAYPSHWATSDHWMVHYLSAEMTERPERRSEEAAWMADFDSAFAVRHAAAFEALYRRLGLNYFGIDCAELPNGQLLLFEADVAMIVHDLDPADVFPYKKPAMRRLFSAFAAMVQARAI